MTTKPRFKTVKLPSGYWTILNDKGQEVFNTVWETRRLAQYDLMRVHRAYRAGKTIKEYFE